MKEREMARKSISRPAREAEEWLHDLARTLGWKDIEKVKRALGALLCALEEPRLATEPVRPECRQDPPDEPHDIQDLLTRVLLSSSRDDTAAPGERERAVFDLLFPGRAAPRFDGLRPTSRWRPRRG
jgi:uncharacterized protein (DUF2267 family)